MSDADVSGDELGLELGTPMFAYSCIQEASRLIPCKKRKLLFWR